MDLLTTLIQSGIASLAACLAAHVLLCLVPAFFIAGALSALAPQQSIIRFLGPDAPKWVAYPAAARASADRQVAGELGVVAEFDHVRDLARIMEHPIAGTPALVIDGTVKVAGRMPSKDELKQWLGGT